MRWTRTGVVGLLVLSGFGAFALATAQASKPEVRVGLVAPPQMAAGTRAVVVVEMTLGDGWHVNSHSPGEKFLIPTDVSLTATLGTLSEVRYPPHVEKHFAFADKPMLVYEGTVRFEADLSLPAGATGEAVVAGTVSFQSCNERQCFAPAKLPVEAKIAVLAR
jgi:DsbC/DsbD-like thiol-disulfide interchange protein